MSAPATEEGTSTTFCPYCSIHLAFPNDATLIQCPSCSNTLDPNAPHQIRCVRCSTLLAYPPHAVYIQCPQCSETMETTRPGEVQPQTQQHHSPAHTPAKSGGSQKQSAGGGGAQREQTPGTEGKKKRDPNMPKAVTNAYMIFCKSRRDELRRQYPELPFGKVGAKLGEIWRGMTVEQRKPYEDRAALDRERYRREMQEWQNGKHVGGDSKRQKVAPVVLDDDELRQHPLPLPPTNKSRKGGATGKAAQQQAQQQQEDEEEDDEQEDDEFEDDE